MRVAGTHGEPLVLEWKPEGDPPVNLGTDPGGNPAVVHGEQEGGSAPGVLSKCERFGVDALRNALVRFAPGSVAAQSDRVIRRDIAPSHTH